MGRFDFINFDSEESRQIDREIAKELGIELVPNPFFGKKNISEKEINDFFKNDDMVCEDKVKTCPKCRREF